jgi:AcrR family transcriptional regulator
MEAAPSRREEHARATREALVQAALELFAKRGYREVGTEEIVSRAQVTRGALYHHFRDKRDLFRAAHERVEKRLAERIANEIAGIDDPWELLIGGLRSFLDACEEPAVKQIALIDAPSVLGWTEWREVDARYGLGLMRVALTAAMDAGVLRRTAVEPLSHLLLASLAEAGLVIADANDPDTARRQVEAAMTEMLEGLRARGRVNADQ